MIFGFSLLCPILLTLGSPNEIHARQRATSMMVAETLKPFWVSTKKVNGSFYVRVDIGNEPYWFLLDTGARYSTVARNVLHRHLKQPKGELHKLDFMIGATPFRGREVYASDQGIMISPAGDGESILISGVLGMDILASTNIFIDFWGKHIALWIERESRIRPKLESLFGNKIPFRRNEFGEPFVNVFYKGKKIEYYVDIGSFNDLISTMSYHTFSKLPIVRTQAIRLPPPFDLRDAGQFCIPSLKLGNATIFEVHSTTSAINAFEENLMGTTSLSGFGSAWLDFTGNYMRLPTNIDRVDWLEHCLLRSSVSIDGSNANLPDGEIVDAARIESINGVPIDLSNVHGTRRSIDASVNIEMRTSRVKLAGTKNKTYWFVNWGIEPK
jgi:hypothetical protein